MKLDSQGTVELLLSSRIPKEEGTKKGVIEKKTFD